MCKGMKSHNFYHSHINHNSNITVCNIPVQQPVIQIGFRRQRTSLLLTLVWFITTTATTIATATTFGSIRSNPMLAFLTSLTIIPLSFGGGCISLSSKSVKCKINFVTAYRQLSYHYRYYYDHQNGKQIRNRFYTTKESIDKNDSCATNDSTTRTTIHESKQSKQEQQQEEEQQNYIFGYGSLMCPLSREITNKNLINKFTIPICIYNIQRQFCARTTTGYTAMGIQFVTYNNNHNNNHDDDPISNEVLPKNGKQQRVYTTGILIGTIDSIELMDLDLREASYDRVSVPLNTITTVPFINPNVYSYQGNHEHSNITTIIRNNSNHTTQMIEQPTTGITNTLVGLDYNNNNNIDDDDSIKVWVYVPKNPIYPDTSHPILQSYIDIIIRGCYNTYGEQFARSFITTTNGWVFHNDNKNSNHNTVATNRYWVNDRDFPLYKRADRIYSTLNAAKIDHILLDELNKLLLQKGNTTDILENESTIAPPTNIIPLIRRTKYDPILHLEQLVQTLQNDIQNFDSNNNDNNNHSEMIHPMAFHHFVSRMNNFEQS